MISESVKMYMYLPTSKRYYALNDRAINLLMGVEVDMSVAVGQAVVLDSGSDAELVDISVKKRGV